MITKTAKTVYFRNSEKSPEESLSIDMIKTLQNLGISPRVANHKREVFHYYSIVLVQ